MINHPNLGGAAVSPFFYGLEEDMKRDYGTNGKSINFCLFRDFPFVP